MLRMPTMRQNRSQRVQAPVRTPVMSCLERVGHSREVCQRLFQTTAKNRRMTKSWCLVAVETTVEEWEVYYPKLTKSYCLQGYFSPHVFSPFKMQTILPKSWIKPWHSCILFKYIKRKYLHNIKFAHWQRGQNWQKIKLGWIFPCIEFDRIIIVIMRY